MAEALVSRPGLGLWATPTGTGGRSAHGRFFGRNVDWIPAADPGGHRAGLPSHGHPPCLCRQWTEYCRDDCRRDDPAATLWFRPLALGLDAGSAYFALLPADRVTFKRHSGDGDGAGGAGRLADGASSQRPWMLVAGLHRHAHLESADVVRSRCTTLVWRRAGPYPGRAATPSINRLDIRS